MILTQEIHSLWMSLGLEEAEASLETVDAQESHCGGVVVFVTGTLHRKVRPSLFTTYISLDV